MHDWQYFFHHVSHNLDTGIYRIFEPQWKAQILHWFGREDVGKSEKEDFVKSIIDFDDGCGNFYRYRAYSLAAEAITYFPNCSLGDAIVEQILKWSYAYFRQDKCDWKIFSQPLVKAARAALEVTDRKRVIAAYTHLIHTTKSRSILRIAAEKLGKLDLGNKSAIAALVLLIQVTQDYSMLLNATKSLLKIDPDNPIIIPTLLKLVQIDPCGFGWDAIDDCWLIVRQAAETISENSTGKDTLIRLMHIADEFIYELAISSLERIATSNEREIAYQIQLLQNNEYYEMLCYVASILLKIDPDNSSAIATLTKILETTPRQCIRWQAADALLQADSSNQLAIAALVELVQYSMAQYPPPPVLYSLERIDPSNQLAIDALVQTIQTCDDEWTIWQATSVLGRIGVGSEVAITALTSLLHASQDEDILREAAHSLGQIDPGNEIAIATLVKLIQTTENESYRIRAADSLGQIDPGNEIALATLMQCIEIFEDDDDEKSYLDLAFSLRKILLSEQMPQVVTALKDYLSEEVYKSRCDRYDAIYNIIWHCAQNMTYPDFYKAWHSPPRPSRV